MARDTWSQSAAFPMLERIYLSNVSLSAYRGIDWRDSSNGVDHGERDGLLLSGLAACA